MDERKRCVPRTCLEWQSDLEEEDVGANPKCLGGTFPSNHSEF